MYLIVTNVLLTATDTSGPRHGEATALLNKSAESGIHFVVSGQVLREYLVVATRPMDVNGFGLRTRDALDNVREFLRCVHLCDENEATARTLRDFALRYDLQGKRLHDANIVATMVTHGIRTLVTQNADDFACFAEIELLGVGDVPSDGPTPRRPGREDR